MKYNQQDKTYKLIKRYFNEKKTQYIQIKDKGEFTDIYIYIHDSSNE